jgi:hypothetical protein
MIGGEGPLCDRCADERIASATAWPTLGDPPPPDVFRGPDGTELPQVADTERFERESGWRLVLGGAWMSSPRPGWAARGRMAGIPGEEVGL